MPPRRALSKTQIRKFRIRIYRHFRAQGRAMPWRRTTNPYRILVSEIMLQQTQVSRVLLKYPLFIQEFPTFAALARAPLSHVLTLWQGLGYNRRAQKLHETAKEVVSSYRGRLPQTLKGLTALPGIGVYSAGAIYAFAFNKPSVIIETNIRSVYIHFFFKGTNNIHDKDILPFIEETLDTKNPRAWYFALMHYGAMLKETVGNPNKRSKHHARQGTFKGSSRELRGRIITALLTQPLTVRTLSKTLHQEEVRVQEKAEDLVKDGLLRKEGSYYAVLDA